MEKTITLRPTYEIGEKIDIMSMGLILPAVITHVDARVSLAPNNDSVIYIYAFKHDYNGKINGKDPWTWDNVPEEDMKEMMWYAKDHFEKTGGKNYGKYYKSRR
jgi:hypothetical protein